MQTSHPSFPSPSYCHLRANRLCLLSSYHAPSSGHSLGHLSHLYRSHSRPIAILRVSWLRFVSRLLQHTFHGRLCSMWRYTSPYTRSNHSSSCNTRVSPIARVEAIGNWCHTSNAKVATKASQLVTQYTGQASSGSPTSANGARGEKTSSEECPRGWRWRQSSATRNCHGDARRTSPEASVCQGATRKYGGRTGRTGRAQFGRVASCRRLCVDSL